MRNVEFQEDMAGAAVDDGTCHRCYSLKHRHRDKLSPWLTDAKGRWLRPDRPVRQPMDDAAVERERQRIDAMVLDRRARGIPAEGLDPEAWATGNGGLYGYEVP